MNETKREDLIKKVENQQGCRSQMLGELKIPRSTYYHWQKICDETGISGLGKTKPAARRIWNRLTTSEVNLVIEVALLHPELSPRLIAVKITDENGLSVSESTVYRILKENNLIAPRPLPEMPQPKNGGTRQKAPMKSGSATPQISLS